MGRAVVELGESIEGHVLKSRYEDLKECDKGGGGLQGWEFQSVDKERLERTEYAMFSGPGYIWEGDEKEKIQTEIVFNSKELQSR